MARRTQVTKRLPDGSVTFLGKGYKKDKIVVDAEGKFMIIKGVKYYPVRWSYRKNRGHQVIYEQINEEQLKKMQEKLVKAFSKKLSTEQILNEVISRIEYKQLVKLISLLKKKKKISVNKGCIDIEIGGQRIPIV